MGATMRLQKLIVDTLQVGTQIQTADLTSEVQMRFALYLTLYLFAMFAFFYKKLEPTDKVTISLTLGIMLTGAIAFLITYGVSPI